jgi:hypothetical protein
MTLFTFSGAAGAAAQDSKHDGIRNRHFKCGVSFAATL